MTIEREYQPVGPPFVSPHYTGTAQLSEPQSPEQLEELLEIMTIRALYEQGVWPTFFFEKRGLPATYEALAPWCRTLIDNGRSVDGNDLVKKAAAAVRMDHPFDAFQAMYDHYRSEPVVTDPQDGSIPFVEGVGVLACAHMAIYEALKEAFVCKYEFKQPRPISRIEALIGYNQSRDFIQSYDHPAHWSDPAGHGAFFGATAAIAEQVWPHLSDDEKKLNFDTTLAAAHFRSVAFMHDPSENQRGHELGYEVGGNKMAELIGGLS
jgi:hypothetical protein